MKNFLRKKLALCITSFFIFLSLAMGLILSPLFNQRAYAFRTASLTEAARVDQIWNTSRKRFNGDKVTELLKLISGDNSTNVHDISSIKQALQNNGGVLTSLQMAQNCATALGLTGEKNITVKFGSAALETSGTRDLEWTPTYLSTIANGDIILTLWLSDSPQLANTYYYNGIEHVDNSEENNYYGVIHFDASGRAGFRSPQGSNSLGNEDTEYPDSMYATSFIRTCVLNNGGTWARFSGVAIDKPFIKTNGSAFSCFTMGEEGDFNDITDFIVAPVDVSWQKNQSQLDYDSFGSNLPNEAWDDDTPDTGFYSPAFNFASKENNSNWKYDKVWLPSATEVGCSDVAGMWNTLEVQRENGRNATDDPETWLRSGCHNNATCSISVASNGQTLDDVMILNGNTRPRGVRPALHLNLTEMVEHTTTLRDINLVQTNELAPQQWNPIRNIIPEITVEDSLFKCGPVLGEDYTIEMPAVKTGGVVDNAGEIDINIVACENGRYTGTKTLKLNLQRRTLALGLQHNNIIISSHEYIGEEITPSVGTLIDYGCYEVGDNISLHTGSTYTTIKDTDYEVNYYNNVNISTDELTATAVITGIGNYVGEITIPFRITRASISHGTITLNKTETEFYFYQNLISEFSEVVKTRVRDDDNDVTIELTLERFDGETSTPKDYILSFYTLSDFEDLIDAYGDEDFEFSESDRETYSLDAVTDVGMYVIVVMGINNFAHSLYVEIEITQATLHDDYFSIVTEEDGEPIEFVFCGKQIRPEHEVSVTGVSYDFEVGVDYNVSFGENINAGTNAGSVTFTAVATGNFRGSVTKTFNIERRSIASAEIVVSDIADLYYINQELTPDFTITDNAIETDVEGEYAELVLGTDYSKAYTKNKNASTETDKGTITITGIGNYIGTTTKTFNILPRNITNATFPTIPDQYYTTHPLTPSFTITDFSGGLQLVGRLASLEPSGYVDYTFSYDNNIIVNVESSDKAKILITGTGNYTGSKELTFNILPENIGDGEITLSFTSKVYMARDIRPTITLTMPDRVLGGTYEVPDYMYDVEYIGADDDGNMIIAKTYTIKLTGKINYSGSNSAEFTITPAQFNQNLVTITLANTSVLYTARDITINFANASEAYVDYRHADIDYNTSSEDPMRMVYNTDYTLFNGYIKVTYVGETREIATAQVVGSAGGSDVLQVVNGYVNNHNVGIATVVLVGKGPNFVTNSVAFAHFTIEQVTLTLSNLIISNLQKNHTYTGSEIKATFNVACKLTDDITENLNTTNHYTLTYNGSDYTNVGNKTFVIEGKGNYKGSVTFSGENSFNIVPKEITGNMFSLTTSAVTYNEQSHRDEIEVSGTYNSMTLTEDDFTMEFYRGEIVDENKTTNFTNAGTITILLEGTGNYCGSVTKDFVINKWLIDSIWLEQSSRIYNAEAYTPAMKALDASGNVNKPVSTNGYEFVYTYHLNSGASNWVDAGTIDISINIPTASSENFGLTKAEVKTTFTIYKWKVASIVLSSSAETYNSQNLQPSMKAIDNFGSDVNTAGYYFVFSSSSWTDNIADWVNVATIKISASIMDSNNYELASAEVSTTFTINRRSIKASAGGVVSVVPSYETYTGSNFTPTVRLSLPLITTDMVNIDSSNFTYKYYKASTEVSEMKDAGTYTIRVTGIGNFVDTVDGEFIIHQYNIANATITFGETGFTGSYSYNKFVQKPEITVTYGSLTLEEGSDYDITYHKNDSAATGITNPTDVGTYYVKVKAKSGGNYSGETTQSNGTQMSYRITSININGLVIEYNNSIENLTFDNVSHKPDIKSIKVGNVELYDVASDTPSRKYLVVEYFRSTSDFSNQTTDFTNSGVITIRITPDSTMVSKGNIDSGTKIITYEIAKKSLTTAFSNNNLEITGIPDNIVYNRARKRFTSVSIKDISTTPNYTLGSSEFSVADIEGTDYINVGNNKGVTITASATSNYTGSFTKTFNITKAVVDSFVLSATTGVFNDNQHNVTATVKAGTFVLNAEEYKLTTYREVTGGGEEENSDIKRVGDIYFVLSLKDADNYELSASLTTRLKYTITPAELLSITLAENNKAFKGEAYEVSITKVNVKNNTSLNPVVNTDYTVTYNGGSDNHFTNVGSYPVVVTGVGNYTGTVSINYVIVKKALQSSDIKYMLGNEAHSIVGSEVNLTRNYYKGDYVEPYVSINEGRLVLVKDVDYTFAIYTLANYNSSNFVDLYPSNNYTTPNTYKLVVRAKDDSNYSGVIATNYTVVAGLFDRTTVDIRINASKTFTNGEAQTLSDSEYSVFYTKQSGNDLRLTLNSDYRLYNGYIRITLSEDVTPTILTYRVLTSSEIDAIEHPESGPVVIPQYTYKVENGYANNINAGYAFFVVQGKTPNFEETTSVAYFKISPIAINATNLDVTYEDEYEYTGSAVYPEVTVKYIVSGDNKVTLTDDDYRIEFIGTTGAEVKTFSVIGKNNYEGTVDYQFTIKPKELEESMFEINNNVTSVEYTGSAQQLSVTSAKYKGRNMNPGSEYDYIVKGYKRNDGSLVTNESDMNFTDIGKISIVLKGVNNFTGEVELSYNIVCISLERGSASVALTATESVYTGSAKEIYFYIDFPNHTLVEGVDYEYVILDSSGTETDEMINVGVYTIEVTGKGVYEGTISAEYEITPYNLVYATRNIGSTSFYYSKEHQAPTIELKYGETITLQKGTDYEVEYHKGSASSTDVETETTDVGTYYAVIIAKENGNYTGRIDTISYTIAKVNLEAGSTIITFDVDIDDVDYVFDNTAKKIEVVSVKVGPNGVEFFENETGYIDVTYYRGTDETSDFTSAGEIKIKLSGCDPDNIEGEKIYTYVIDRRDLLGAYNDNALTITGISNKVYNREVQKLSIGIVDQISNEVSYTLNVGREDFIVSYDSDCKNAKEDIVITIASTLTGNYKNSINTLTYTIEKAEIDEFTLSVYESVYTSNSHTIVENVSAGGMVLNRGEYQLAYTREGSVETEFKNVGTIVVALTIAAENNFKFKDDFTIRTREYTITQASITKLNLSSSGHTYDKTSHAVTASSVESGSLIVPTTDYSLSFELSDGSVYLDNCSVEDVTVVTVTATASGNFKGTAQATYTVSKRAVIRDDISFFVADTDGTATSTPFVLSDIYKGKPIAPKIEISDISYVLSLGSDYTFNIYEQGKSHTAENNLFNSEAVYVNAGNYDFVIEAKGNFDGSFTIAYVVAVAEFNNSNIAIVIRSERDFTGNALTADFDDPLYYVTYTKQGTSETKTLEFGNEFEYYNGYVQVVYTSGSQTKIESATILDDAYGLAHKDDPDVVKVNYGYINNVNAGTATMFIVGKSPNFTTTQVLFSQYTIKPIALTDATTTVVGIASTYPYTGFDVNPFEIDTITVTSLTTGRTLNLGTDFEVSYTDNKFVTDDGATLTIKGKGNYSGSYDIEGAFKITKAEINSTMFNFTASVAYNTTDRTPTIVARHGAKVMDLGTDFEVTYKKGETEVTELITVGVYTLNFTGIGNYTGTATKTFTITKWIITSIELSSESEVYNGSSLKPTITALDDEGHEVNTVGYEFTFTREGNFTTVGSVNIYVNVIDQTNYSVADGVSATFTITPRPINANEVKYFVRDKVGNITNEEIDLEAKYKGNQVSPYVKIPEDNYTLVENTDFTFAIYTLSDFNGSKETNLYNGGNYFDLGDYMFVLSGTGNFTGTIETAYKVEAGDLNYTNVEFNVEQVRDYTASPIYVDFDDSSTSVKYTKDEFSETLTLTYNSDFKLYNGYIRVTFDESNPSKILTAVVLDDETGDANLSIDPTILYVKDGYIKNTQTGTATVVITGNETNFNTSGVAFAQFTIQRLSLRASIVGLEETYEYTGYPIEPEITVISLDTNQELVLGEDYELAYSNNTDKGYAHLFIQAINNYEGVIDNEEAFLIVPKQITEEMFTISEDVVYNKTEQKPTITARFDAKVMTLGEDYTLTYKRGLEETDDLTNEGTIKLELTGINNYGGTITINYKINKWKITEVKLSENFTTFTGSEQKPTIRVVDANDNDVDEEGYSLAFSRGDNFTTAGIITISVNIINSNYELDGSSVVATYTINRAKLSDATTTIEDQTYSSLGLEPTFTLKLGDYEIATSEYAITNYNKNVNVGTADINVNSSNINFEGSAQFHFNIVEKELEETMLTVEDGRLIYTGGSIEPNITLFYNGETLTKNKDYSCNYTNNVNANSTNSAILTITGSGNYKGELEYKFSIDKANPTVLVGVPEDVLYYNDKLDNANYLLLREGSTPGVITNDTITSLNLTNVLRWSFMPTDTNNYNSVNDVIDIVSYYYTFVEFGEVTDIFAGSDTNISTSVKYRTNRTDEQTTAEVSEDFYNIVIVRNGEVVNDFSERGSYSIRVEITNANYHIAGEDSVSFIVRAKRIYANNGAFYAVCEEGFDNDVNLEISSYTAQGEIVLVIGGNNYNSIPNIIKMYIVSFMKDGLEVEVPNAKIYFKTGNNDYYNFEDESLVKINTSGGVVEIFAGQTIIEAQKERNFMLLIVAGAGVAMLAVVVLAIVAGKKRKERKAEAEALNANNSNNVQTPPNFGNVENNNIPPNGNGEQVAQMVQGAEAEQLEPEELSELGENKEGETAEAKEPENPENNAEQPAEETKPKEQNGNEGRGEENKNNNEEANEAQKAGAPLDKNGNPLPPNVVQMVGPDGKPLPPRPMLGPDGKPLPPRPMLGPDGKPLPPRPMLGPDGKPLPPRPMGPNGRPLPPRPMLGPDGKPLPPRPMLGPDGKPLPPRPMLGPDGKPLPPGPPMGPNGQPLPPQGRQPNMRMANMPMQANMPQFRGGPRGQINVPMQQGRPPMGPNGRPLPPRPMLGPDGKPLPPRPMLGPDGKPLPPRPILGPDGKPLPPRPMLGPDGKPLPPRPIGPNGRPLPPRPMLGPDGKPLPPRPMLGPDGKPLPPGPPMGPNGQPLPPGRK